MPFTNTYTVEIYKNPTAALATANRVVNITTRTTAAVSTGTLPKGDYGWRVQRLDVNGKAGAWTSLDSAGLSLFTVQGTAPVPQSPQDGAQLTNGNVLFQWSATAGASRYLVEASTSDTFATKIESVTTDMTSWAPGQTSPAWPNGPIYWRVSSLDATGGILATSEFRRIITPPGAPTVVTATAGNAQAVVSWTAPARNGGSPITGYTVTATPGGLTGTTTGATTATVIGLTNATAYTFTVTATNAAGTSSASLASAKVTPNAVPDAPAGVTATAGNAQAVVSWTAPASNGGYAITKYTVTAAPGGISKTTTGATTATFTGLTNDTSYTFAVTATNAIGISPASAASPAVTPKAPMVGFTGQTPTRVLDTRVGAGAKLGAGSTLTLTIPNLPAGTTAVALNVAVTGPTSASFLTVYPGGTTRPTVGSNLNYLTGQTIPNMVLVPVGPGNKVIFYNKAGTVHVIADLIGTFAPGTGQGFTGTAPTRVLDTRVGAGAKLGAGSTLTLTIPGLPAGTTAVALNVAVTGPTSASFLTVYPGGQPRPTLGSNLNYLSGQTIPNMVLVPVGPGGTVSFYNSAGTVHVIADLVGTFAPGTGQGFTGTAPTRVLDTRVGTGGKLGVGSTLTLTIPNLPAGATAVALNVAVTGPTSASFLTVYPGGQTRPTLGSNLNYLTGQTIPNMVLVPVGPGGTVSFYNSAGTVHVIADLVGYYK
jgi:hypothetical protein